MVVLDLGSRHVEAGRAAAWAGAVDEAWGGRRRAHKIDSLLRGNWATEVVRRSGSGRAVVVAALPEAGRCCIGGVVGQRSADGRFTEIAAAASGDARGAPFSSRPADHLRRAGAWDVVELADPAALAGWLAHGDVAVAVCDATSSEDLAALSTALHAHRDVLVAGSAAAVADLVAPGLSPTTPPVAVVGARVLVVVGSVHAAARRQLDALVAQRRDGVEVIATPTPPGPQVGPAIAAAAAATLGAEVRAHLALHEPDVIIIIGGDTAAAVLGDVPLEVAGTAALGTAVSRAVEGPGPIVVTRSGSFGNDQALVDLVAAIMAR